MSGSEPGEAGAIPAEDGADAVAPSETEAFEEIAPGTDALAAPEAEGDATTEEDAAERLLNQDEIDSLMGFEFPVMAAATQTGMQRIITSGLVSYERLPMLEVVFDGLVRIMSTSLRNLTDHNVDVGIETVASMRFGDCLNAIPLPAILAVFKVEEWDNYGLIVVDGPMIYSIVDVLLGGRHGGTSMRIEGRPYTTIERNLVEQLIRVVLADLATAFDPLCPVVFKLERLEVNPTFAAVSRMSNAAVVAKLRVDMEDRGGTLQLVLPYATLEPVRELLLQQFMGEKFGRDSIWESHLAEELHSTEVELDAVLDEQTMRLSDVMALRLGSRIMLSCAAGAPVQLRCGAARLFMAHAGRRKNRVAVRIERELPRPSAGGA
jgi:flagellar motor switch protein FliM